MMVISSVGFHDLELSLSELYNLFKLDPSAKIENLIVGCLDLSDCNINLQSFPILVFEKEKVINTSFRYRVSVNLEVTDEEL